MLKTTVWQNDQLAFTLQFTNSIAIAKERRQKKNTTQSKNTATHTHTIINKSESHLSTRKNKEIIRKPNENRNKGQARAKSETLNTPSRFFKSNVNCECIQENNDKTEWNYVNQTTNSLKMYIIDRERW